MARLVFHVRCFCRLFILCAAFSGSVAFASDDHMRARQALEAGEVLPLRVILEKVELSHPGEVIEVELERDDGVWIYEIKLLRKGGGMLKLKLDARDGQLLGVKGRGQKLRCRGDISGNCLERLH